MEGDDDNGFFLRTCIRKRSRMCLTQSVITVSVKLTNGTLQQTRQKHVRHALTRVRYKNRRLPSWTS